IEQFADIDRLVPRLDPAALNAFFFFDAQLGELFAPDVEGFIELARQCSKPAFVLRTPQLDHNPKTLPVLALFLLGFLPSLSLLTLLSLAFLNTLPAFLFTFALFLLDVLLFGPILATAQLPPILARLLLLLRKDGPDRLLELLLGG